MQTDKFAQMDAFQNNRQVPSAFPGVDFYLTAIQVQLLFATEFLEKFITHSTYREYVELNTDDKIFFHEPINKYFDLLWVRKLVWTSLQRIKPMQDPLTLSRAAMESLEAEIS